MDLGRHSNWFPLVYYSAQRFHGATPWARLGLGHFLSNYLRFLLQEVAGPQQTPAVHQGRASSNNHQHLSRRSIASSFHLSPNQCQLSFSFSLYITSGLVSDIRLPAVCRLRCPVFPCIAHAAAAARLFPRFHQNSPSSMHSGCCASLQHNLHFSDRDLFLFFRSTMRWDRNIYHQDCRGVAAFVFGRKEQNIRFQLQCVTLKAKAVQCFIATD